MSRHRLRVVGPLSLSLGAACGPLPPAAQPAPPPIELTVESVGDVTLTGTLFLPSGAGPHPAVIFTHGSEPGTREHPGYLRWAEGIRDRGVAVLVFDKRGTGESEGVYVEAPDLSIPATDVVSWFDLLRTRPDVDPSRIGVLGWSQGGWVGPLAASRSDLAFVVMISGPAVSPLEQNIFDKSNSLERVAPDAQAAAQAREAIRLVMTYLVHGEAETEARAAWEAVLATPWFESNYDGIRLYDRGAFLEDPRGKTFVAHNGYDPEPALRSLEVPVLAVYGEADRAVPVAKSLAVLADAFEDSPRDLTTLVYPGADHGITVPDGAGGRAPPGGYPDTVFTWVERMAADLGGPG